MTIQPCNRSADAAARATALDTTRSFSVQAPAGSGKTELLTQRMLCLLAHVESPEEVLAFTFTRKAAGEMRQRLVRSLHEAAATPVSALQELSPHKAATLALAHAVLARDREQEWQLLKNTQRLRVMTIDSFNHGLTAMLPLSASMGGAARITEDIRPIFTRAVQTLLGKLENRNETARLLGILLGHLHNNLREAEQLLASLLYKRDQWLSIVSSLSGEAHHPHELLASSLHVMIGEALEVISEALSPWAGQLMQLIRFSCRHLTEQPLHINHALAALPDLPPADSSAVAHWRGLAAFLLTRQGDFRKRLTATEGFPGKSSTKDKALQADYDAAKDTFANMVAALSQAGLLPLVRQAAMLPDPRVPEQQQDVLNALVDLLPLLAGELVVAMKEAGEVDYTQTTLAALQALGSLDEPTDLALKLDYRISHILVDEFQDTSTIQYQLLESLTRGWEPGDGRTLFVVGDGMQSCYGFRNARVELFMQMREKGLDTVPMEALDLSVNFRSDQSVVDTVNAVFSRVFPDRMDSAHGGVTYNPGEARPGAPTGVGVHLDLWIQDPDDPVENPDHDVIEAEAVADRIMSLQQEDAGQSIAILVRNRRHIDAIVPVLRRRGIRFNAAGIDPLLSYPVISDLFVLLKAILNLADDISWFALLRSPMVGLQLEDFTEFAMQKKALGCSVWTLWQHAQDIPGLDPDAVRRLERSAPALARARRARQQDSLRTVLENLWEDLGGPYCVTEEWMLPNIDSFLALVDRYDEAAQFNLGGFAERLQSTWGNVAAPDVKLTIQTIHKAKGLEFDAVLIPGLQRGGGRNDSPLLLWHEYIDVHNNSHPILALLPSRGQEADPLYEFLKHEAGLREDNEATRLLYIGVTRAVRGAWLFARAARTRETLSAPAGSLLQTIESVLDDPPSQLKMTIRQYPGPAGVNPVREPGATTTQPLLRLSPRIKLPSVEEVVIVEPAVPAEEPQHQQLLVRQTGELVHLGLQMLVELGSGWLDPAVPPPLFRARLMPLCETPEILTSALVSVMSQLQACLSAPDADWLFSNTHRESACELAMVDYRQSFRRDHIIDRTFIDESGTRWIIDYKSSVPPAEGSLDDFMAAETARYRPQLETYASLFADRPEPVRTALFFTAFARLHPL